MIGAGIDWVDWTVGMRARAVGAFISGSLFFLMLSSTLTLRHSIVMVGAKN